ncbi:pyrolysin [Crepidotus variabilis]|uniref:Pyrolysin n=1 Tax=Crepidotus variabilis TaxID=179855 RepID=A0A9P6ECR5_9AGAR|nr:pyrolysin [Crepidotus variabilis]
MACFYWTAPSPISRMKLQALWTLLLSLLTLSLDVTFAKVPLSSVKKTSKLPNNLVPNEFIIEVDELSKIPTKRSYTRSLDALYDLLRARDVSFKVKKEFDSTGIFVGAAVSIKTAQDAAALASTPGIIDIRPVYQYSAPKPVTKHVVTGPNDAAVPPDGQSTHVMTGVDKLHKESITGKGIKIGIIDTGVDYTHPALGGAFGPGHKIVGGYDFVGDNFTGSNEPVPDNDPLDQCGGHGTHVAGIIGAIPGNQFNTSGVAYDSEIYAYRVFGCDGFVPDDVLIDALLRGVKDGNHIITLSIGGADGWTEGATSVVASRIAKSGKIVTIAAGNDGSAGMFFTSGPGNAINDISVASVDNVAVALQSVLVSGATHDPVIYFATFALPVEGSFPIYATSNDTTVVDDACAPLPDSTPDLSKYVTIIRRGSCTFVQKLDNAATKGAKVVLIYDNGNGFAAIDTGDYEYAALIQSSDGEYLVGQYKAGVNILLTFLKGGRPVDYPDPNGGLVSAFSTYGPSNDFYFKPAVAAPGGKILSTYPVPLGSYAVLSGTSMATPFIAGVSALLLQVKGNSQDVTAGARTLFETTATYIPSNKTEGSLLQTLAQQGAGLINAYNAIHAPATVTPGELILNDTTHFNSVHTFTVKNNGKKSSKYKVKHVPAGTALTLREGEIFPEFGPVPLADASAQVVISPNTFEVGPGKTQTIRVTFQLPSSIPEARLPLYSGFIEVTGASVGDTYHVSYIGLKGSLKDQKVLDDTDYWFTDFKLPVLLNNTTDVQTVPTNYTFVNNDYPSVLFRLAFGSASVRIDLVDPKIKFVPTISPTQPGRRATPDDTGTIFSFPHHHDGGSFANVKIIGSLAEFTYVSRNDEVRRTFFILLCNS